MGSMEDMKTLILIASFIFAFPALAQKNSIEGAWRTIDDETGKPKSIVEIKKNADQFTGRIIELINPSKPNPVCEKCSGEKKDQPITGLEIIWGLKEQKAGEEWGGGEILDPKNGKVYNVRLRLKDDGQKLEVRGFIGVALFGRNQTWERVK